MLQTDVGKPDRRGNLLVFLQLCALCLLRLYYMLVCSGEQIVQVLVPCARGNDGGFVTGCVAAVQTVVAH